MVINKGYLHVREPIKGMEYRKIYEQGVSHGMSEAGYDIRVKQDITFHRDLFWRRTVDILEWNANSEPTSHERHPGRFALASSIEEFVMPDNLVGIVHDKSTWARRGLSVFNTVIEPGWKGFLTLELVFHGWNDLHIPAGAGIAQVIFHQLEAAAPYVGRYQNQADRPIPAIAAEG